MAMRRPSPQEKSVARQHPTRRMMHIPFIVLTLGGLAACGYSKPLVASAADAPDVKEGNELQFRLVRDKNTGALSTVAEDSPYCTYLDSKRRLWGWIAAGTAIAGAGGAAVSTAIQNQNDYGRAGITISFLVMGAFAALSGYLTNDYAQTSKAHGCIAPGAAAANSAAPAASTAAANTAAPAASGSGSPPPAALHPAAPKP